MARRLVPRFGDRSLPPLFRALLLRRAIGVWVILRLVVLVVGILINTPVREVVFLTAPAAAMLTLLTAWLVLFDARRRGEALFLANLAVPTSTLLGVAALPPLGGELAVRALGLL
jgi:hypothetical protein